MKRSVLFAVAATCAILWSSHIVVPAAVAQHGPSVADTIALSAPSTWVPLGPADAHRVSPQWSPDGATVISRGWAGLGLYAARFDGPSSLVVERTLIDDYRGPIDWVGGDVCVSVVSERGPVDARLDLSSLSEGEVEPALHQCQLPVIEPGLGEMLFENDELRIFVHPFEGTVTAVLANGEQRRLVEGAAISDATMSPDGTLLALTSGPLPEATLLLIDLNGGVKPLGAGAQPAWAPDGRTLVFVRPEGKLRVDGRSSFEGSEMWAYMREHHELVALTSTDEVVEMEPDVSPDGTMVAFSDWRSGRTFVASLQERASR